MTRLPLARLRVPPSLRLGFPLASAVLALFAVAAFYFTVAAAPDLTPFARLLAFSPVLLASYRRQNWAPGLAYTGAFAFLFLWHEGWSLMQRDPNADLNGALASSLMLLAASTVMRSIAAGRNRREALSETARERGELLERATSLDQVAAFLCDEAAADLDAQEAGLLVRNPVDDRWELYTRDGLTTTPERRDEPGFGAWLAGRNETLVIDDLPGDGRFESRSAVRSVLARPLRNPEGTLIAVLILTHPHPGRFLPDDVHVLDALVAAGETALGHASSYERSGRVTERVATQLAAIQRTARQINADLTPASIASQMLACAIEITWADAGAILIEAEDVPPLTLSSNGPPDARAQQQLASASRMGLPEAVGVVSEGLLIPDAASRLTAPIRSNARNFGSLMLENRSSGAFSIQDMQALSALASHAAVALENVRLFREVRGLAQFQRDLLATFSHELRAPLANISALVEVALGDENNKASPEILELLKVQSRRLATLSQRTLAAERLEVGAWPLEIRPLAVAALAREAAHRWQGATPDRQITVRETGQGGWVWGDEDATGLILDNLLENAIKHSPPRSGISVSLARGPGGVTIGVEDCGEPIPEEQRERLFDRFYRRDLQANRKTYGVGLGLYIVRQLSQAMGGRAWVEPVDGAGNRFAFCLPAMEETHEDPGGGG